SRYDL
ncbi:unnamed protein product, partial [Allacma fusca]